MVSRRPIRSLPTGSLVLAPTWARSNLRSACALPCAVASRRSSVRARCSCEDQLQHHLTAPGAHGPGRPDREPQARHPPSVAPLRPTDHGRATLTAGRHGRSQRRPRPTRAGRPGGLPDVDEVVRVRTGTDGPAGHTMVVVGSSRSPGPASRAGPRSASLAEDRRVDGDRRRTPSAPAGRRRRRGGGPGIAGRQTRAWRRTPAPRRRQVTTSIGEPRLVDGEQVEVLGIEPLLQPRDVARAVERATAPQVDVDLPHLLVVAGLTAEAARAAPGWRTSSRNRRISPSISLQSRVDPIEVEVGRDRTWWPREKLAVMSEYCPPTALSPAASFGMRT